VPLERLMNAGHVVGMMVSVCSLKRRDAHAQEARDFPGIAPSLHEPSRASVPERVGDHLTFEASTRKRNDSSTRCIGRPNHSTA
jgi:hypothetical protein